MAVKDSAAENSGFSQTAQEIAVVIMMDFQQEPQLLVLQEHQQQPSEKSISPAQKFKHSCAGLQC